MESQWMGEALEQSKLVNWKRDMKTLPRVLHRKKTRTVWKNREMRDSIMHPIEPQKKGTFEALKFWLILSARPWYFNFYPQILPSSILKMLVFSKNMKLSLDRHLLHSPISAAEVWKRTWIILIVLDSNLSPGTPHFLKTSVETRLTINF